MVSMRCSVSRALFECAVVSEPSWPVFMAWSMSSASPPRTSPTMIRSGRMRRALITSWRIVTCPLPSMLGGRASSRTRCFWFNCNSAESSIVTMRSEEGKKLESMLSRVVLPVPVPPETTIFCRAVTQARRKSIIFWFNVPTRSMSASVNTFLANLRMLIVGPFRHRGGMMMFTREPSGRRASTIGLDSSTRRPRGVTMRSTMRISSALLRNTIFVSTSRPRRSM